MSAEQSEAAVIGFTDYDPAAKPYAAYSVAAIWPFATGLSEKPIYVCWENPDASAQVDRDLVKEAVQQTWDTNSRLRLRGWEACEPNNRGIRIRVEDSGPHVKALGRFLDGRVNGMVLNFKFSNWSTACAANEPMRRTCIYVIAVHEFGHAIGVAHEQNRWDAPGECQALRQGTDGDLLLTPYDPDSVMNYCNKKYNNNGQLSEKDIKALHLVYGEPI